MKTLTKKLQEYHFIRISNKSYNIQRANKMRYDIMKDLEIDMGKFQEMYFNYVNELYDNLKPKK